MIKNTRLKIRIENICANSERKATAVLGTVPGEWHGNVSKTALLSANGNYVRKWNLQSERILIAMAALLSLTRALQMNHLRLTATVSA